MTRHDVDRLVRFLKKFPNIDHFYLVEDDSSGIGSSLYLEIEDEEIGYDVKKRYTISGVEHW